MITVGIGIAASLDLLGHLGDVNLLPVVDLHQRLVELAGGVVGIEELLAGAPALGRSLLEQTDRVAVAVVEVSNARFLVDGGHGDRSGPRGQTALHRQSNDDGRVVCLFKIYRHRPCFCRGDTALLTWSWTGQP